MQRFTKRFLLLFFTFQPYETCGINKEMYLFKNFDIEVLMDLDVLRTARRKKQKINRNTYLHVRSIYIWKQVHNFMFSTLIPFIQIIIIISCQFPNGFLIGAPFPPHNDSCFGSRQSLSHLSAIHTVRILFYQENNKRLCSVLLAETVQSSNT